MTMKDEDIRSFFHQNRPQTASSGEFLSGLSARMDAAAEIKRMHDATVRRYRRISAVTLVAGLAAGILVSTFLLLTPAGTPDIGITAIAAASSEIAGWKTSILGFILQWKSAIFGVIAVSSVVLSLLPRRRRGISPIK